jgi:hypothetical protein
LRVWPSADKQRNCHKEDIKKPVILKNEKGRVGGQTIQVHISTQRSFRH